jgi:putative ABC transport system permease protein
MFFRLLLESLARRRSRKVLAVLAVWIGISLVIGLLMLSLDVGDKMNRELRSFGANIKLEPAGAALPVRVGGHELAPAVNPGYLDETKLSALQSIFWANNLLEVSPRLWARVGGVTVLGIDLKHHPGHWRVAGTWPTAPDECLIGADMKSLPSTVPLRVTGVATTGDSEDGAVIASLATVQKLAGLPGKISEADISALTTPENKLAEKYRLDPKSLTPTEYERWYCTPYPGVVAANIQDAVPGSVARVVRRVSESQGVVLTRIGGLVALLGLLAAMACALSVMGVLTSAVLERRSEVALLRAIGAQRGNVLHLFVSEAGLLGFIGGALAGGTGGLLGGWLLKTVFGSQAEPHAALLLIAPLLGLLVAMVASALPILHTLRQETAQVLHGN